ncbi:MAG: hypothetical protein ACI8QF_000337 [Limisphaerales bacterium]
MGRTWMVWMNLPSPQESHFHQISARKVHLFSLFPPPPFNRTRPEGWRMIWLSSIALDNVSWAGKTKISLDSPCSAQRAESTRSPFLHGNGAPD